MARPRGEIGHRARDVVAGSVEPLVRVRVHVPLEHDVVHARAACHQEERLHGVAACTAVRVVVAAVPRRVQARTPSTAPAMTTSCGMLHLPLLDVKSRDGRTRRHPTSVRTSHVQEVLGPGLLAYIASAAARPLGWQVQPGVMTKSCASWLGVEDIEAWDNIVTAH